MKAATRGTMWVIAAMTLIWGATVPAPGAAGTADEQVVKQVRVEVVEDGKEKRRVVFVNGEGDARELGDHPVVWLNEDGYGFHFGHGGAFLGVDLTRITPELRTHFGVPEDRGVLVAGVVDDSPAARAGIRTGDIVTAVDGEPVESTAGLIRALAERKAGDRVSVEVWRDGHPLEVDATLAERQWSKGAPHRMLLRKACEEGEACGSMRGMEKHRFYSEDLCGDLEDCTVTVQCKDEGACSCKVNGEDVDCPESMK